MWRIVIARAPSDRHAQSAASYLGWDHDRLDALLDEYTAALTSQRLDEARHRFAEFRTGLKRHIRMEEQRRETLRRPGSAGSRHRALLSRQR